MTQLDLSSTTPPGRAAPLSPHPFDRMIPVTMSHYPITYSGVINNPDDATLDHYMSRLGHGGQTSTGPAMLYIHIPFCDQICTFCRYAREKTPERAVFEVYAEALKKEMRRYLELRYVQETRFDLIYFGGGTPSVMPIDIMADLIGWINRHFQGGSKAVSFEGEARTLQDKEYLSMLKENGTTRISMGVQSFDPKLRKVLGRHEALDDIYATIANAKQLGMEVNFDLLYWLPYQTIAHIEADIEMVRKLQPTDVDWYNMVYDPLLKGDPLSRLVTRKNEVVEDTQGLLRTREAMRDGFRAIGYQQHFVDNYASGAAKDAYHVIRSGNYDGSGQTLGVGVSSLGTLGNFVYSNPDSIEAYYDVLDKRPQTFKWIFDLTPARQIERTLFHFARNMLLPKSVFARAEPQVAEPYVERVEQLVRKGLVEDSAEHYALTEEGKLWYGNVASHLLGHAAHERMLKKLYMRILQ
jgi:anaerobilin synthase